MAYTLYKLLQNNTVKIPLIQRDYAQGRSSVEDLRNSFIEKIKKIIDGSDEKLNLDFVYGYTTKNSQDKIDFIPLDGQQRLTTLWLLHWYFGCKDEVLFKEENDFLPSLLLNFTYETRVSSKRFCEKLVLNPIKIKDVNGSLKKEIINMPWFMSSWNNDPTITAMLIMLDTIHDRLEECKDGWVKLTENELITFDYIDIKSEEFKLTDELYIKMNSRGKPLTPFENFKAIFSQLLSEKLTDYNNETLPFGDSEISYQQYFAFNVDGKWIDLFWSYRDLTDNELDDNFLNFFYYVAEMLHYSESKDDSFERNFESLKRIYFQKRNVDFLFKALDFLSNLDNVADFFNTIFSANQYVDGKVRLFNEKTTDLFFKSFMNTSFDVQQRVLLFGILHYCIEIEINSPDHRLKYFTRILRNLLLRVRQANTSKKIEIISNLRLPNFFDYSKFVLEFVKLIKSNGTKGILDLFVTATFKGFSKESIVLEQKKIAVISANKTTEKSIIKLEEHTYIEGITDCFNIESDDISMYVEAFYNLWELNEINNSLLVRALLTKGDFSVQTHNYSSLGIIKYFGAEENWNRILAPLDKDERLANKNIFELFLKDYIASDKKTISEKLNEIIGKYEIGIRDWRYYFIKYNEITSTYHDRFNLFTWGDSQGFNINSLGNSGKQPLASYHINPYLIAIEQRLRKDGVKPNEARIVYGRYTDDLSCIFLPKNIQIYVENDCYEIYNLKKHRHHKTLIEEFNLEIVDHFHILKETNKKDKVEIAINFCQRTLEL
ncbi:uncharacterized protein DUF262 [Gillisia mitskevichiae]|uniref:Uncharacterized protein DUF262 n=1 Tax=Gillisia mitskevichiae TaxID=270921 RepID=A0A495PZC2_9FLAO|nr:DUF262 domain-containing protein [Gillisia mitskevichiae]RKS55875.1 uncharacterized protein DUF262 [Gillisia mitskevichiae]